MSLGVADSACGRFEDQEAHREQGVAEHGGESEDEDDEEDMKHQSIANARSCKTEVDGQCDDQNQAEHSREGCFGPHAMTLERRAAEEGSPSRTAE